MAHTRDDISAKTDEELVKLVLENQDYFGYIIDRYQAKLTRFVRRISAASVEEAEDVLQDVFLKVYQNLHGFDTSLKFSSWIYRITRNQVISNYRKREARPKCVYIDPEYQVNLFVSDLDVAKTLERKITREILEEVLDSIDKKYRDALVLKFLEEKDYKEISDILKKPMGTVATLINRGKQRMKKQLELRNLDL